MISQNRIKTQWFGRLLSRTLSTDRISWGVRPSMQSRDDKKHCDERARHQSTSFTLHLALHTSSSPCACVRTCACACACACSCMRTSSVSRIFSARHSSLAQLVAQERLRRPKHCNRAHLQTTCTKIAPGDLDAACYRAADEKKT